MILVSRVAAAGAAAETLPSNPQLCPRRPSTSVDRFGESGDTSPSPCAIPLPHPLGHSLDHPASDGRSCAHAPPRPWAHVMRLHHTPPLAWRGQHRHRRRCRELLPPPTSLWNKLSRAEVDWCPRMPGGGAPWRIAPTITTCWFVVTPRQLQPTPAASLPSWGVNFVLNRRRRYRLQCSATTIKRSERTFTGATNLANRLTVNTNCLGLQLREVPWGHVA